MVDIDLEWLADAYRLRPMSDAATARAMQSVEGAEGWLLDVGGGTGDHAATWVGHGRLPIVVDPARAMVVQAAARPGVSSVQGVSQHLPFVDDCASLVYFHLSIHYGDWRRAIDEAMRVTKPGGRIEIWTMDRGAIRRSSLGKWFPEIVDIDTLRFPDPSEIRAHGAENGGIVEIERRTEPMERPSGEWMRAVRGRFVSTLQLLDDDAIELGLARFTAENPDPSAPYRYQLELTRISIAVQALR